MHVRHGDFTSGCPDAARVEDCFAPFSAYATRVREVQAELRATQGVKSPRGACCSHPVRPLRALRARARRSPAADDTDPAFWARVRREGWAHIDHAAERTRARHGEWHVILVDVVAQSLAAGFVGTDRSTVSVVSARRVRDWNGGATRMVRWGKPGADAH